MKKVLILGGGISGLEAAIKLQSFGSYDVTLISNRDFAYLYPAAIWIPTGEKSFDDACIPLRETSAAHGFAFRIANVSGISSKENKLLLEDGEIAYDYLVLANGAGKVALPGMEHTNTVCGKPEDVLILKEKLDALIREGRGRIAIGVGCNLTDKPANRGGPSVEVLLNIHHYLSKLKVRDKFELTFFSAAVNPMINLGETLAKLLFAAFKQCNTKTFCGTPIKEFVKGGVIFEDGNELVADLIMFTPGLNGHPLLQKTDLPLNASGFVKINKDCLVQGTNNVFAVGDVAAVEGPDWLVRFAPLAENMGIASACNIHAMETGNTTRKYYTDHLWVGGLLDGGNGAGFVYKNDARTIILPLPILGHWLKKRFLGYWKNSRMGKTARIMNL